MDTLPDEAQLLSVPFGTGRVREVPVNELQNDKVQYVWMNMQNPVWVVGKITNKSPLGLHLQEKQRHNGKTSGQWEESATGYGFSRRTMEEKHYFVPIRGAVVDKAVAERAKVQAVKDIMGQRGLPNEMDTGPLGNILGMAGIKAPPKGARRKTRKTRRKATRRRFSSRQK